MQTDGNLVAYDANSVAYWASMKGLGASGAIMTLQDGGNIGKLFYLLFLNDQSY